MSTHRYFVVNKPYNMLSQFISEQPATLLSDLAFDFPAGIHAVGRLDKQSEGLLILTTDKRVTRLVFQGELLHKRTYLVKVKNLVSAEKLQQLRTGVAIRVEGGGHYTTRPCEAAIVEPPTALFAGETGRYNYPPFTWLQITLTEGKFRQIRKMNFAIGHRVQRLIRLSIEDLKLGSMMPGEVKELDAEIFFRLLKIKKPSEADKDIADS